MGLQFYTGAAEDDGCNRVAIAINKEVQEHNAINMALINPTARDFRDALISSSHRLDTVVVYDMNSVPMDFDHWKDAWRDQVAKAATGMHPSAIQR